VDALNNRCDITENVSGGPVLTHTQGSEVPPPRVLGKPEWWSTARPRSTSLRLSDSAMPLYWRRPEVKPFLLDGLSGEFGILTRITEETGAVVNELDSRFLQ
jgi:hypothetical protein